MLIGRIIGWVLILVAMVVIGFEATAWLQSGEYHALAAGEIWYRLGPASLNGAQAGVQRYVHPLLWDPVITSLLLLPASLVAAVPGLLLVVLCRRRRKKVFT